MLLFRSSVFERWVRCRARALRSVLRPGRFVCYRLELLEQLLFVAGAILRQQANSLLACRWLVRRRAAYERRGMQPEDNAVARERRVAALALEHSQPRRQCGRHRFGRRRALAEVAVAASRLTARVACSARRERHRRERREVWLLAAIVQTHLWHKRIYCTLLSTKLFDCVHNS